MNLAVNGIKPRADDDPEYADFWLELQHTDTHISWEVPLNKNELEKLRRFLPKWVQEQVKVS